MEALVTDTSAKAHQEGRLSLLCEMHPRFYTQLTEIAMSKSAVR